MTATATDKRIDELSKAIDHRFDRVEGNVREIRTDVRDLRTDVKSGVEMMRGEVKGAERTALEEARALRRSLEDLRTLMIRFFAGTLGSILAGVVVAVLGSHFWG